MRRRWRVGTQCLTLSLLLLALTASASANHDGNWTWRKQAVPVIDRTTDLAPYVAARTGEWNAVGADITLNLRPGDPERGCQRKDGAVVVCQRTAPIWCVDGWSESCARVFTKITTDGDKAIYAVVVILAGPWLGCHELGHALGLNHGGECMASPSLVDSPGDHDAVALRAMY